MLLLLFDIDGTLLQQAATEHALALREAAGEVHGVSLLDVDAVEYAGRTDVAIARDLLAAAGVTDVDARWEDVGRAAASAYERLCPADLSAKVAPGMVELLDRAGGAARTSSGSRSSPATSSRSRG